jgi:DtxR family Mn-dependent transcriptional regulator
MLTTTEENYIKALLRISAEGDGEAGTNQLAARLDVRPATVTDMVKKLREKSLVDYKRYGKIRLTDKGRSKATEIVRKHRLWETFLFDKLGFSWDEVHEVAEQLEHIQSDKLIEQLDKFLGYPKFDPHGDTIPNANGDFQHEKRYSLAESKVGENYTIIAVRDNSPEFLQYASRMGLTINSVVNIIEHFNFDGSIAISIDDKAINISQKVAENIYIK